jgi:cellulose biosynthesis protein BcsQ
MGGPAVQDVLVAVAAHQGTEGAEDLERNVALTDLRVASRQQRDDNRTKKNTRRKSEQPKFIRVATRFHQGRPLVVSFASPKGGVAKSTTSANFAAYVAKAAELSGMGDKVRVLLVDGDVANGNMALRLAHTLTPNMLDMVNHMDQLSAQGLKMDNWQRDISPFVLAHPKLPNMDILAAPDNPEVITQLKQEDLNNMMAAWAQFYQVVVFDCGTQITEFTNCAWLSYSSQVYLMVEPELACLNSTTEFVKRARKGQLITPDVCRVVCIRADMDLGDIPTNQIVGDVFSFVPHTRQFYWADFHRDAIEAGNSGELLTLDSAEYAEAMTPVVRSALESYEQDFKAFGI